MDTEPRNVAELVRLLPLWPEEAADGSRAGRERMLALLRQALRSERRRARAGHWTYNLTRHAQLHAVYHRTIADFTATFGAPPAGHDPNADR